MVSRIKFFGTCRLCVIFVREDTNSNVHVMIIWLIWITWTSMSAVRERPLNVTTHTVIVYPTQSVPLFLPHKSTTTEITGTRTTGSRAPAPRTSRSTAPKRETKMLVHNGRDTSHIDLVFAPVFHKDCSLSVKVRVLQIVFWNSSCHTPALGDISSIWIRPHKPKMNANKKPKADHIIVTKWFTSVQIYTHLCLLILTRSQPCPLPWSYRNPKPGALSSADPGYRLYLTAHSAKKATGTLSVTKKGRRIHIVWKEAGKQGRRDQRKIPWSSEECASEIYCRKRNPHNTGISWKPQPETRNYSTSSANIRPSLVSPTQSVWTMSWWQIQTRLLPSGPVTKRTKQQFRQYASIAYTRDGHCEINYAFMYTKLKIMVIKHQLEVKLSELRPKVERVSVRVRGNPTIWYLIPFLLDNCFYQFLLNMITDHNLLDIYGTFNYCCTYCLFVMYYVKLVVVRKCG